MRPFPEIEFAMPGEEVARTYLLADLCAAMIHLVLVIEPKVYEYGFPKQ